MDSSQAPNQSDVTEGPTDMVYIVEPLALRIFRLTLYVIIFLLATFGNALVIFVVYKTRELHTGKTFQFFAFTYGILKRKLLRGLQKGMTNQVPR